MSSKSKTDETRIKPNSELGFSKAQMAAYMQMGDTQSANAGVTTDMLTNAPQQGRYYTEEGTITKNFGNKLMGTSRTEKNITIDENYAELANITPEQLEAMQKAFLARRNDILSRRLKAGRSTVMTVNPKESL